MAPTVREDPKYQRIQQGAAEVDDYVLQEFLTDIIDSAPFNAAGNQTIQLLDQTKPQVFGNGNGREPSGRVCPACASGRSAAWTSPRCLTRRRCPPT